MNENKSLAYICKILNSKWNRYKHFKSAFMKDSALVLFFCMWISNFSSTTYVKNCFQVDTLDPFIKKFNFVAAACITWLYILFHCLLVYTYTSAMLFWLLLPCSIVYSQVVWSLHLCPFWSELFWLILCAFMSKFLFCYFHIWSWSLSISKKQRKWRFSLK